MKNTKAILGLESFKGEKFVTYLGLFVSFTTLALLYVQYKSNLEHMKIQAELAKAQLDKLKNGKS